MRGYKNFESSPHPGDLKHLLEIGYTENTINENGYPDPITVQRMQSIPKRWSTSPSATEPM